MFARPDEENQEVVHLQAEKRLLRAELEKERRVSTHAKNELM